MRLSCLYPGHMRTTTLTSITIVVATCLVVAVPSVTVTDAHAAAPSGTSISRSTLRTRVQARLDARRARRQRTNASSTPSASVNSTIQTGFPLTENWQETWGIVDGGLVDHMTITTTGDTPFAHIAIPAGLMPANDSTTFHATGGFSPSDRILLTYDVRLPKDFIYGRGGMLPCLYGGTAVSQTTLWCAILWDKDGRLGIVGNFKNTLNIPTNLTWSPDALPADGMWHTIQVEARMNSKGHRANGLLRISLDGSDILRTNNVLFRTTETQLFEGMAFNALYRAVNGATFSLPTDTGIDVKGISLK